MYLLAIRVSFGFGLHISLKQMKTKSNHHAHQPFQKTVNKEQFSYFFRFEFLRFFLYLPSILDICTLSSSIQLSFFVDTNERKNWKKKPVCIGSSDDVSVRIIIVRFSQSIFYGYIILYVNFWSKGISEMYRIQKHRIVDFSRLFNEEPSSYWCKHTCSIEREYKE